MPCYHPLKGWRAKEKTANGKYKITFDPTKGLAHHPMQVPCYQCIGCRLSRSQDWALRCMHEASLYEDNSFITLTYNDKYLPKNANLKTKHFQDFMKRLRKRNTGKIIRFYHCGEYGQNDLTNPKHINQYGISNLGRPHYHAILFNHDFEDKVLIKEENGLRLYESQTLNKTWSMGFATIGSVTFESAAYVARYCTKKIYGKNQSEHYQRIDPTTGEQVTILPEYTTMSRGGKQNRELGGIGSRWIQLYKGDVYPKDFTTVSGRKIKPPRYYDNFLELYEPEEYEEVKNNRTINQLANRLDNTKSRLSQKEAVKLHQAKQLIRQYDEME